MNQTVLILDFGGQYAQLIARRVRECNVYSLIVPYNIEASEIRKINPIGLIFSGGPHSVYDKNAPDIQKEILKLNIPILAICYGMQLIAKKEGTEVLGAKKREYGKTLILVDANSPLFIDMEKAQEVLMSHGDQVKQLPKGYKKIAYSENCPIAAMENRERKIYAIQFHPEVKDTKNGKLILRRFLYEICNASGDYTMKGYISNEIVKIKEKVKDGKVLLALSGGVDSSVAAVLIAKAIPNRVYCVFVDHGFMRKNEPEEIREYFSSQPINFIGVDAVERFGEALKGVSDPETKRKIIGKMFIDVFAEEAKKLGNIEYLAQGTIYPDVVESGTGKAALIKSHHNVGGLPEDIKFLGIVEPLRGLFKDEVRKIGRMLGIEKRIVNRQPFPGPGLAIRIIGEPTKEKLNLLKEADYIFREELQKAKIRSDQYFAVLTGNQSVGVKGDARSYEYTIALRAVKTSDFMTCEYTKIPFKVLTQVSNRITNEVSGVNRVVYDITSKPPATIEWE